MSDSRTIHRNSDVSLRTFYYIDQNKFIALPDGENIIELDGKFFWNNKANNRKYELFPSSAISDRFVYPDGKLIPSYLTYKIELTSKSKGFLEVDGSKLEIGIYHRFMQNNKYRQQSPSYYIDYYYIDENRFIPVAKGENIIELDGKFFWDNKANNRKYELFPNSAFSHRFVYPDGKLIPSYLTYKIKLTSKSTGFLEVDGSKLEVSTHFRFMQNNKHRQQSSSRTAYYIDYYYIDENHFIPVPQGENIIELNGKFFWDNKANNRKYELFPNSTISHRFVYPDGNLIPSYLTYKIELINKSRGFLEVDGSKIQVCRYHRFMQDKNRQQSSSRNMQTISAGIKRKNPFIEDEFNKKIQATENKAMPQFAFNYNDNALTRPHLTIDGVFNELSNLESKEEIEIYLISCQVNNNQFNINAVNEFGETLVSVAAQKNNKNIIEVLCALGADVNLPDTNNVTPVCFAAQKGHFGLIALLIKNRADLSIADVAGKTPYDYAPQFFNQFTPIKAPDARVQSIHQPTINRAPQPMRLFNVPNIKNTSSVSSVQPIRVFDMPIQSNIAPALQSKALQFVNDIEINNFKSITPANQLSFVNETNFDSESEDDIFSNVEVHEEPKGDNVDDLTIRSVSEPRVNNSLFSYARIQNRSQQPIVKIKEEPLATRPIEQQPAQSAMVDLSVVKEEQVDPRAAEQPVLVFNIQEMEEVVSILSQNDPKMGSCAYFSQGLIDYLNTGKKPNPITAEANSSLEHFAMRSDYGYGPVAIKKESNRSSKQQRIIPIITRSVIDRNTRFGGYAPPDITYPENDGVFDLTQQTITNVDTYTQKQVNVTQLNAALMLEARKNTTGVSFGVIHLPPCGEEFVSKNYYHQFVYYATPIKVVYIDCLRDYYSKAKKNNAIFMDIQQVYRFAGFRDNRIMTNTFYPNVFYAPMGPHQTIRQTNTFGHRRSQ